MLFESSWHVVLTLKLEKLRIGDFFYLCLLFMLVNTKLQAPIKATDVGEPTPYWQVSAYLKAGDSRTIGLRLSFHRRCCPFGVLPIGQFKRTYNLSFADAFKRRKNSYQFLQHCMEKSTPFHYNNVLLENFFEQNFIDMSNKRSTGLNGHLSIQDFARTSCQRGSYLYINSPIIE